MFGCLTRVLMLVLLLVLLGIGWLFRDQIRERVRAATGREPEPATSMALADQATQKLERLVSGQAGNSIALSEAELQALVENRLGPFIPAYVIDPRVSLDDNRAVLAARLPIDQMPQIEEQLGEAARLLPDTTEIRARGQLIPLDSTRVALAVDEVSVARIPLPRRYIPRIVQRLRRADDASLPPDALSVPLPPGVGNAYIRGDSVVLVRGAGRPFTADE